MVRNPITRRSGGFLEAGWLTAIAITPVLFNVYSARAFDNSGLVRSIAFLMAAIGLMKLASCWWHARGSPGRGPRPSRGLVGWPLIVAVSALAVSVLVSTLLSVSPAMSWWGSDEQGQGALSQLSYLVLFASVALSVRRASQIRRILGTVVLASLPVGMYSMLQRLDIDPIRWSVGAVNIDRGGSTLGNAGFLGGYLVLVIPLTAFLLYDALAFKRSPGSALQPSTARVWVYGSALALQLLALQHSGSRGPILGLAGAVFLCLAAFALGSLSRRWLAGIVAMGLAVAIGLLLLNVSGGPLEPLRGRNAVGRFSHLLELSSPNSSNTSQARVLIWQAGAGLLSLHAPLTYNSGASDGLNWARPFFGYGAGTTSGTLARFVPAAIEHYDLATVVVNRAHNLIFDLTIAGGLVGLAAYLAVFAGLIYAGIAGLWSGSRPSAWRFGAFAVAGMGLGALAGAALGPAWIGLLTAVGLLAGIGAYLLMHSANVRGGGRKPANLLVLALLAALVGHFIETQFAFEVNATSTYFWIFAGLLAALRLPSIPSPVATGEGQGEGTQRFQPQPLTLRARPKPAGLACDSTSAFRTYATAASILCVLGVALVYDFVKQPGSAGNLLEAVWISFTTVPTGGRNVSYGLLILVLIVWLAGTMLGSADSRSASLLLVVPPTLCLGFAGCHLWLLNRYGSGPLTATNLLTVAMDRASTFGSLNVWLLLLGLPLALALGSVPTGRERLASGLPLGIRHRLPLRTGLAPLFAAVVLAGAGIGAVADNVRPAQADMLLAVSTSDFTGQVRLLAEDQAASLGPAMEAPRLALARTYVLVSQRPGTEAPENALRSSERETDAAAALNPLDPQVEVIRADIAREHARVAAYPDEASSWQAAVDRDLGMAVKLEPNRPARWRDWADLAARDEGDYQLAFSRLERAFMLDPAYGGSAFQGLWNNTEPNTKLFQFAVDLADYEATSDALAHDAGRRASRLLVAAAAHDALHDEAGAYARRKQASTIVAAT